MQSKLIPILFSLLPEKSQAIEISCGIDTAKGRDEEVGNWIKKVITVASISNDDGLKATATGFLLGYIMRGYDNILDFRISESEIALSILKTNTARELLSSAENEAQGMNLFSEFLNELGVEND